MAASNRYYLISLPIRDSATASWSSLQQNLAKVSFDTPAYKLHVPDLRVGTLDSLLSLSDDLVKANSIVEGITQKIRRQIEDLERASGSEVALLSVGGVPIESYITRFTWDEAKYPIMTPLREILNTIQENVARLEDDLKVRVAEYNNVKGQLNAINRKQSGSMAVRDLSNLVKADDIVDSEHLTTLLSVVSKHSQKDWISCYEILSDFVVPRSSKKIHEDNEYALYTVTLFRKVSDTFKTAARERGFQTCKSLDFGPSGGPIVVHHDYILSFERIRDFEYDPEARQKREEELVNLTRDQETMKSALQQWCYAIYGDVFSSWMHLCAIRVFIESILRYGLPPSFLAAVLSPSLKSEKKVRSMLATLADEKNSSFWKSEDDVGGLAGLAGGEAEVHPYVSLTLNLGS